MIAEADARRVERVLRNLVVNAVEHGEGKDVVVRLAAAGGAVAVAVRDYGVGLKPGEATRVFSRFWRADPARARTTGGTGLGLSIAVEDARLHGGWLQAWGEPGGGSQFRLTLPRTAGEPLRGSPIPLEPEDSRRNRGLDDAGLPRGGGEQDGDRAVPSRQTAGCRHGDPIAPRADVPGTHGRSDGAARQRRARGAAAGIERATAGRDAQQGRGRDRGQAAGRCRERAGGRSAGLSGEISAGSAAVSSGRASTDPYEQGEALRGR